MPSLPSIQILTLTQALLTVRRDWLPNSGRMVGLTVLIPHLAHEPARTWGAVGAFLHASFLPLRNRDNQFKPYSN